MVYNFKLRFFSFFAFGFIALLTLRMFIDSCAEVQKDKSIAITSKRYLISNYRRKFFLSLLFMFRRDFASSCNEKKWKQASEHHSSFPCTPLANHLENTIGKQKKWRKKSMTAFEKIKLNEKFGGINELLKKLLRQCQIIVFHCLRSRFQRSGENVEKRLNKTNSSW